MSLCLGSQVWLAVWFESQSLERALQPAEIWHMRQ